MLHRIKDFLYFQSNRGVLLNALHCLYLLLFECRDQSNVGLVYVLCLSGNSQLGATIVDALDTLYIMGLHEEFKDGQEWIEQNLDFSIVSENLYWAKNICKNGWSSFRRFLNLWFS